MLTCTHVQAKVSRWACAFVVDNQVWIKKIMSRGTVLRYQDQRCMLRWVGSECTHMLMQLSARWAARPLAKYVHKWRRPQVVSTTQ